jgi:hypothetical protein
MLSTLGYRAARAARATAQRRGMAIVAEWATLDAEAWTGAKPHTVRNLGA